MITSCYIYVYMHIYIYALIIYTYYIYYTVLEVSVIDRMTCGVTIMPQ